MRNPAGRGAENVAIRIFTADERTGSPVPGVVLELVAVAASGEGKPLTSVVTDNAGFASCKIAGSLVEGASHVNVIFSRVEPPLTVSVADLAKGLDSFRIPIGSGAVTLAEPQAGLPSIVDPDVRDAFLSPASIGLIPSLRAGLCRQLMPTNLGVRRYGAFQVHADICDPETIECGERNQIRFVRGKILEYEIAWHPLGTSLGELLNTITLAPCERVGVVISDWVRREAAFRDQASSIRQETTQDLDHARLIVESLNSDVKTKSLAAGFAASFGATFPVKKINVTAAAGGGISGSISTQQVAATATNRLSEHITQAATLVASSRSSVVFQATASERRLYQTRFVTNHNKCHTLTLMYYQVNRNYRVVTSYKGERDAILVQYPNLAFDAERAHCNAGVLREALLDKSLDPCFDELGKALFCCDETPAGADVRMESITLTANVGTIHNVQSLTVNLLTVNGSIQLPSFSIAHWQSGVQTQTLTLAAPIDPAIVKGVLIIESGFGFANFVFLHQLTLTYQASGIATPLALYSSASPVHIHHAWTAEVKPEIPPPDPRNECVEKSCCIQKLLGHLNCHRRYYNSVVWLNENPNDRVMRWSCCRGPVKDFDLIGSIENTPLAVYGDYVVFPVAASPLVDDPTVLPVSQLVTIPTQGVYSEGILGQCDTCEIVDPQRFTDWACCDAVTDPEFPDPQSGATPENLKPDAITNLINLTSVPTAPESILKTLLETLLSNAKSGGDDAKVLLEKFLDLIKATLTKPETSS